MKNVLSSYSIINLLIPISVVLILSAYTYHLNDNIPKDVFKTSQLGRSMQSIDFKISTAVYLTSTLALILDTLLDRYVVSTITTS